jgi:predicted N-acetyltransferase YhbS
MDFGVRAATDDDIEAIVELNRDGNGDAVGVEIRQGLAHGAFSASDFAVVTDERAQGRVVSTFALLSLRLSVGETVIPAGQPEFVVTHPDYRNRGLVRRLFELVHQWSAQRGDLIQIIAGIPYFYRQFGYDYAIPFPAERLVPPESTVVAADMCTTRKATPDDIPAMRALQDDMQRRAQVRLPFAEEVWPVLLSLPHVELAVATGEDGQLRGVGRIRLISTGHVRVTGVAATDRAAARALLLRARHAHPGASLVVADRTVSPISAVLGATDSLSTGNREWLYVRIPDPGLLLAHLKDVLSARLSASLLASESGRADISLYRSTIHLSFHHGVITDVATTDDVTTDDDDQPHLPPELFGRILLGPEGVLHFAEHPDVNLGGQRELLRVLFPPLEPDVLMW